MELCICFKEGGREREQSYDYLVIKHPDCRLDCK